MNLDEYGEVVVVVGSTKPNEEVDEMVIDLTDGKLDGSSSTSTVTSTKVTDYGNLFPAGTGGGAQSNMELDNSKTDEEAKPDKSIKAEEEDDGLIEETGVPTDDGVVD